MEIAVIEKIKNRLSKHFLEVKDNWFVNEEFWTNADLIARQFLNNACDGFGMVRVKEGFDFILDNIDTLKENNMLSEKGFNNSGFPLWDNWDLSY